MHITHAFREYRLSNKSNIVIPFVYILIDILNGLYRGVDLNIFIYIILCG